jgi:hypothetical protein
MKCVCVCVRGGGGIEKKRGMMEARVGGASLVVVLTHTFIGACVYARARVTDAQQAKENSIAKTHHTQNSVNHPHAHNNSEWWFVWKWWAARTL